MQCLESHGSEGTCIVLAPCAAPQCRGNVFAFVSLQQGVNNAEKFDYVSTTQNHAFALHPSSSSFWLLILLIWLIGDAVFE